MANPKPSRRMPRYCHHKPSGQARVIIKGRHHYLGLYGSTESWEKYHKLLTEQAGVSTSAPPPSPTHPLTIAELIDKYWDHVLQHNVKDGQLKRTAAPSCDGRLPGRFTTRKTSPVFRSVTAAG